MRTQQYEVKWTLANGQHDLIYTIIRTGEKDTDLCAGPTRGSVNFRAVYSVVPQHVDASSLKACRHSWTPRIAAHGVETRDLKVLT